jgi:non-specific serine/threonine protein kinase
LLRWVAVFRGGLTLAALAKLEKSAPFAGYGPAIELLASLVDKSLVHPLPAQSQAGPDRFTMLETVREFALGELSSSGDWELAHEALLTHFLDDTVGTTMLWVTPLRGEDDGSFFARWEQDLPSVRVALQWALDTGRVDAALRLASSLFLVWWAPGPLHEGRLWLERGLESGQSLDPLTRGLAHLVLSALIQRQHQADLAVHHAKRAIVLFEGIGHIECTGVSHYLLAIAQYSQGNLHAAIRSYRRSRRLLSSCNTAIAAEAMIGEAQVARELGELERAASLYEETLAFQIENHIFWGAALSRYGYGAVLQESGDIAAASKYYLQSLQYWHVIGDLQSLAICLEAIASARCREGNAATAAQLLAAAHATRAYANCPVPPQSVQSYGGLLAMVRATLGAKPFDIAWLAGLKLTPGEAVQLAEASPRDSVPAAPSDVQAKPTFELTSRERDVLRLIADGHTDREIAERLFISRRTASEHVGNILRKIGARSRADAAAFAVRSGLDRSNLQST